VTNTRTISKVKVQVTPFIPRESLLKHNFLHSLLPVESVWNNYLMSCLKFWRNFARCNLELLQPSAENYQHIS